MPPVKTAASSSDVDNDATAELPVLDVAAYEATIIESSGELNARTDSWSVPATALAAAPSNANTAAAIPTLLAAEVDDPLDLSGTHEMPALPITGKAENKVLKATPVTPPAAAPLALPPSPPLIEEWRAALAAAERRIEELTERNRIAEADRAVASARAAAENAQLREQLGQRLEKLHSSSSRLAVQRTDESALRDQLFARDDRIAALQRELGGQADVIARLRATLAAGEERIGRLDADVVNLRAAVARRDAQIGVLEADLLARQSREQDLKAKLADAQASTASHVPELRELLDARIGEIDSLKRELAGVRGQLAEKNADLEVAEESIRNLEGEVRAKAGKLEEASVTVEEWRAVIAESQRSILERDGRIRQLETDLEKRAATVADSAAQTGEEIALEGPARVLIRSDANTDYVHVLGRRTRIGRGSDNELVLDLKHVSRYHAVLLAGPVNTTIEDLRSTNGVFVNGKRASRQTLKDGDRVTIGKTHFRYTVRS